MDNNAVDAELVAETRSGNREAFGRLYDRHAPVVRAVVAGVSGDWAGVEDMTQDCFLRAYRNLPKLRDAQKFGPWIVGMARQVGRERRRTLRRDRHDFRDPQPWEIEAAAEGEEKVANRDELEFVMRKLSELEERERIAVHAFFLDQQEKRHTAELLGLSRSGFYALVRRAIARLAGQIERGNAKEKVKR